MSGLKPPKMMRLVWCPVCGRNDRVATLVGKTHFTGGAQCLGKPISLSYRLVEGADPGVRE